MSGNLLRRAGVSFALSCLALSGVACTLVQSGDSLTGSGDVVTETRTVGDFTKVDVSNGLRLVLTIGSPAHVEISAQANLLPITTTTVSDGRLTIEATRNYTSLTGITATVVVPNLVELALSGGAVGNATGIAGTNFALKTEGGAVATISGTADTLTIDASGGAVLNLGRLTARTAVVDLSGGVTGNMNVTESVSGSASGGVVLVVTGHPASVSVDASGGAIVTAP